MRLAAKIEDLRKDYVLKGETVRALRGITFDVPEGDYVAIMGPSGCGKTTLLNCLSGLDECELGDIWIEGDDLRQMGDKITARQAMEAAGVPVVPGTLEPLSDRDAAAGLPADAVREPALARGDRARVGGARAGDGGGAAAAPGRARHVHVRLVAQRAGPAGERSDRSRAADETVPYRRQGSNEPGVRAVPGQSRLRRRYPSVDGR